MSNHMRIGGVAGGACVTAASWFALLPLDLSELPTGGGGDDYAPQIALVLVVVLVVAVGLALSTLRAIASSFAAGGAVTWAAFFAYFAATAEVSGANFWLIPFVIVVVPSAVLMAVGVHLLGRWLASRSRG